MKEKMAAVQGSSKSNLETKKPTALSLPSKQANGKITQPDGTTPLMLACMQNRVDDVKKILKKNVSFLSDQLIVSNHYFLH